MLNVKKKQKTGLVLREKVNKIPSTARYVGPYVKENYRL